MFLEGKQGPCLPPPPPHEHLGVGVCIVRQLITLLMGIEDM